MLTLISVNAWLYVNVLTHSLTHAPGHSHFFSSYTTSARQWTPPFYTTHRFITAFTRAGRLALTWAQSIHSMSFKWSPSYWFLPKPCSSSLLLSTTHATCSIHIIFLDVITLIRFGEECKSWSSSLCTFLQSAVTFSLFGAGALSAFYSSLNITTKFHTHMHQH